MVTYVKPLQEVLQFLEFLSLTDLPLLRWLQSSSVQRQYLFQRFLRRVVILEIGTQYPPFGAVASSLYCSFQNQRHGPQELLFQLLVLVTRLSVVK